NPDRKDHHWGKRKLKRDQSSTKGPPAKDWQAGPSLEVLFYLSDVLIDVYFVLRLVPRPLTTAIIANEMPAAIRPYSMAVAPDPRPAPIPKGFDNLHDAAGRGIMGHASAENHFRRNALQRRTGHLGLLFGPSV